MANSQSLCPICLRVVDSEIVVRSGRVYQHKVCADHGVFDSLIYSSATDYQKALAQEPARSLPLRLEGRVEEGCPHDCGLCPEHEQHTCVGIIEINDICNLECPVCYADATGTFSLSLETVQGMIDLYVSCEETPEVIQISGGEPTLHPQIFEIMRYAADRNIRFVMLNTNGIKLADKDYVAKLAGAMNRPDGQTQKALVYLQFDGLDDEIYSKMRGRPLLDIKLKAIDNCREAGLPVALVPTVARGVNLDALGEIVDLALSDRNIKVINFQPITSAGRSASAVRDADRDAGSAERVTIPEVLSEIERQTGGALKRESFINIPCPHPTCSVCSYVYRDQEKTVELTGLLDIEKHLGRISNKAVPHAGVTMDLKEAAQALFSMSSVMGSDRVEEALCTFCGIRIPKIKDIVDDVTLISVHAFMDAENFDLERAKRCCITQILPDGKMVPFCVYNVLHRRRLSPGFSKICEEVHA